MSDLPLVSVVVVSYNQGKYIRENLDSIKAQTYPNIELIIADDASKDNSVEVFDEWLAENKYGAKKNYHTQNTGLATVLNECVEMATGKYIKLIAADDFLHPDSIEKCIQKLEELGEDYGMISSDTFCIDENSSILPDLGDLFHIENIPPQDFHDQLIKRNRISALTVLMRTKVLRETGEYDAQFLVEDYQRWLKISEKYYVAYLPLKLAYYRSHSCNVSKAKEKMVSFDSTILQIMFDKKGLAKENVNNFIHRLYVTKVEIPQKLLHHYNGYPYRRKILNLCIQYNISPIIFRIIFRISLITNFNTWTTKKKIL